MRPLLALLAVAFLQSCERKSPAGKDNLVSEWSKDGKTLRIMRKGVQIATFRDSSNACFVELLGPDGSPDASVSYYEGDPATGEAERRNIVLGWSQKDGTMKTVAYDSVGNVVKPGQESK